MVDGKEYRTQVVGRFTGLDLAQDLYLGGVPDFRVVSRAAKYNSNFVGQYFASRCSSHRLLTGNFPEFLHFVAGSIPSLPCVKLSASATEIQWGFIIRRVTVTEILIS